MARFRVGNSAVLLVAGVVAQSQTPASFETLRQALEYCDGHPAYELTLANWLMSAHPRSRGEREVIRWGSAHLFTDTEDRQIALGLANALIEVPLQDLKSDPRANPIELANATSRYLRGELFRIREYPQAGRAKVNAIRTAISLQLIEAPPRQALFLHTLRQRLGLSTWSANGFPSRSRSPAGQLSRLH